MWTLLDNSTKCICTMVGLAVLLTSLPLGLVLEAKAEPAILVWHAYDVYNADTVGNRGYSSDLCSANAGQGWIQGGCPANRTFALITYSYSTFADLPTQFNFSTSVPVMRAALNGVPTVRLANTWEDFVGSGPLLTSSFWPGNARNYIVGNQDGTFNCQDWTSSTGDLRGASTGCNYFAASGQYCCACNIVPNCGPSQKMMFCGCHVDEVQTFSPTSSPSKTPSRSPSKAPTPPTRSPTRREIAMVSTTTTPGGCGASTPNSLPFAKADGSCIPAGFNTAVRATCTGGVPSVTLYTNDQGTCTSSTNSNFPTACRSVTGPGPFGGSITMGFGMTCTEYAPEDLLQVTVYSGSCSSKSDPMVVYMVLNTCLSPPGLPVGTEILEAPFSLYIQAFGTQNNVSVRVQSWNNGVCQGTPSAVNTVTLNAIDGEAVFGCMEGNPHGFSGVRDNAGGRRLSTTFATEIKLHSVPSNLPLTASDSAHRLHANQGIILIVMCTVLCILIRPEL